jgi:hypothetical protein
MHVTCKTFYLHHEQRRDSWHSCEGRSTNEVDDEAAVGVAVEAGLVVEGVGDAVGRVKAAGGGERCLGVAGVRQRVAKREECVGALEATAATKARCHPHNWHEHDAHQTQCDQHSHLPHLHNVLNCGSYVPQTLYTIKVCTNYSENVACSEALI